MLPLYEAAPGPVATGTEPMSVQGAAGVADGWYSNRKPVTWTGSPATAVSWMVLLKWDPPPGMVVPFSRIAVIVGSEVSASGMPDASALSGPWTELASTGATS